MSTPQHPPPKQNQRSARQKKQQGQNSRTAMSENEAYITSDNQLQAGAVKNRPRKKSHAKRGNMNSDATAHSDGAAQRSVTQPAKTQATPIKQQAYAGPTFHQSPAASALPLPSFYSRSVPTGGFMKSVVEVDKSPQQQVVESVEAAPPPVPVATKRESTPLDFLFEAARNAQATPGRGSPQRYMTPNAGSPAHPSPAPREGDNVFPFELDNNDQPVVGENNSHLTPYQERIEAARAERTTSEGGASLDDAERKAKTAALKKFLLNSAQNIEAQSDNPFNAKSIPTRTDAASPYEQRHRSNPTTPYRTVYGGSNSQQYFSPIPHGPNGMSPGPRPPSSNLRNIYAPDAGPPMFQHISHDGPGEPRISTAREQSHPQQSYMNGVNNYTTPVKPKHQEMLKVQNPNPSAQQLEDDLRRFLKLDLAGNV